MPPNLAPKYQNGGTFRASRSAVLACFGPRDAAQRAAIVTRNIHVILSGSGVYGLLGWVVFVLRRGRLLSVLAQTSVFARDGQNGGLSQRARADYATTRIVIQVKLSSTPSGRE